MTQVQRELSNTIVGSFTDLRSIALMAAPPDCQAAGAGSRGKMPTPSSAPSTPPPPFIINVVSNNSKKGAAMQASVPGVAPMDEEELQHASDMSMEDSITESHRSADSGTSSVRFTDIGEESFNFTTSTLRKCKVQILKPYWGLLMFIGWRSFRHDVITPRGWRIRSLNLVYPVFIILLLLYTYMYEMIACEWKLNIVKDTVIITPSTHPTTAHVNTTSFIPFVTLSPSQHVDTEKAKSPRACEHIVTTYLIPNILHFMAYVMGLYYFRIQDNEQMYALMEKVFLQAYPSSSGSSSQQMLVKKTRLFLLFGSVWVFLTLGLQALYVWAFDFPRLDIFEQYGQEFHWIAFSIELLGRVVFNSVLLAVVTNYVTQCEMVMFYVKGLVLRLQEKSADIKQAFKDILLLRQNLSLLNGIISNMTSLALIILAELTVIGLSILALNRYDMAKVWAYRSIFPVVWGIMLGFPLFQAGRVNSVCLRLKKISLEMRVFGYKSCSQLELDSFLNYVHNTQLKAKLFHIPIVPSYLIAIIILIAFVFLILIQTSSIGTKNEII